MKLCRILSALIALILVSGCSTVEREDSLSEAPPEVDIESVCEWAMDPSSQAKHQFAEIVPGPEADPPSCYYLLTSDRSQPGVRVRDMSFTSSTLWMTSPTACRVTRS